MTLVKVECISREARDKMIAANPGSWGGYSCDEKRFHWWYYNYN